MSTGTWALVMADLLTQLLKQNVISTDSEVNEIVVGIQNNTGANFGVQTFQREVAKIKQGKWTCLGGSQTSSDPQKGFDANQALSIKPGSNWVMAGQRNKLNSTNAKAYINLLPDWAQEPITLYIGSNNGGTVWFDYLVSTGYTLNSNPQDYLSLGADVSNFKQQAASSGSFTVPTGQWGTGKNVFKFAWNATDGTSTRPAQIYMTITLVPA